MPDNNYKKARRLRDFESKYILRKAVTMRDVNSYEGIAFCMTFMILGAIIDMLW